MKVGRRSSFALVLALGCALGLGAGCGDEEKPKAAASTTSASSTPGLTGNLTVLAAASLSEAFKELGGAFEGKHPGSKVTFSFDASSALALQANNGAPADLFASADQANMKKVTDAGNATGPRVVAHNKLAIIVAKVVLGEADAGIVYATDVKAAGTKGEGVDIDIALGPALTAAYPIAVTRQAGDSTAARGWVDFVLSERGRRTLAKFGFLAP